ncbi:MAG: L,D-transpeptidase [Mastigocoleus sp.]
MLFRFVLISLSCLTAASCAANGETISSQKLTKNESIQNVKKAENIGRKNTQIINLNSKADSSSKSLVKVSTEENDYINQNLSVRVARGSHMTLTKTGAANTLGNPLYELRLYANGQLTGRFITVTGRAYSQDRNRHQSGTKAPLPNGRYSIAAGTVPGTHPEVGDRFLPIQPLFRTARTDLGIHYDPSFERNNGEDGTSGCIALTNREQLSQVLDFVRNYQPQFIEVSI